MEVQIGIDVRDLALPLMISFDEGDLGEWEKMICINILFFHIMFIWR